jgi:cell division transport system ATP-binding protein
MAVEVMEVLQAINLRGTTVLVATHDARVLEKLDKRVLWLRSGRLQDDSAAPGHTAARRASAVAAASSRPLTPIPEAVSG